MADERIAGYAAAIFEIARGEGALERVEGEMAEVADKVQSHEELAEALADRRLPLERKQAVLEDLLEARAHPLTTAFVSFAVGLGRAGDLPEIAHRFRARAAEARNRSVAEVRSPVPLDEETERRLASALSKYLKMKNEVEVRVVVDETVLGGLVARVGDTVIDGSVKRRLQSLRETVAG